MRIEGGRIINDFIEPNKRQYAIPVYQRNYEWSREQCEKLFQDIVQAYKKDKTHFCGSVVYAPLKEEHNIHYYVIVDGQQRLTTIYLLLKALMDCAETASAKELLQETLYNKDKFDTYDVDTASKLKLKPIKTDNNQLYLLMDGKEDEIDKTSGIWKNYDIFRELVQQLLSEDPDMDIKGIYKGLEKLTCAKIKLDQEDNAQEIFERINSTGVPLSLADQIRNFVLMTDADQEKLYENYWLKTEQLVRKSQMTEFFQDFLNLKMDGLARENEAYEAFKELFKTKKYTNEGILQEILHYANLYHVFMNGSSKYSVKINAGLEGLRKLKQTTVHLFLYRVFDDCEKNIIDEKELEKVLQFLLSYSIRRIMCEISSNSLRGLYKTLYGRVFQNEQNKKNYYDAIVSFMQQLSSRDAIPDDEFFTYALIRNNLYRKHFLCRYLLIALENKGKEKIQTDSLSIEHIMPQNKNLSTAWQKMLGDNWSDDRDRWLHTLGNLTLTGHNSELGDRPFIEKKEKIESYDTKVVFLYKDVQSAEVWNAEIIEKRARRLASAVLELFPIVQPENKVIFRDPRYTEYTCADPANAKYKYVNYYELLGERVNTDGFAPMVRSVARKLYEYDPTVIDKMAKDNIPLPGWNTVTFSYDKNKVKNGVRLRGTEVYISTGYSARDCIVFIRSMLKAYDLDIEEDFIYSARANSAAE